jgi:hypothetical protein
MYPMLILSIFVSQSDRSKSGSPSPWAVFDAWGAGSDVHADLSEEDKKLLSADSVRITNKNGVMSPAFPFEVSVSVMTPPPSHTRTHHTHSGTCSRRKYYFVEL